jgi:hypothetical protein
MKKIYFLFLGMILAASGQAQIQIHWDQEPGIDQGGDTVYWTDGGSLIYPHLYVIDYSGSAQDLLWGRMIIDIPQGSGYTDQVCDDIYCYFPTGSDWVLAGTSAYSLGANDSTDFLPKLDVGTTAGNAHYRYYVYTDGGVKMDSVDVKFTATVGVEESTPLEISAYPNPANNEFNINIGSTFGDNVSVKLYNVLGDEVRREVLVDGNNIISLSNLNNGVYFYSILRNNDLVETKKLIVRH